jgi:transcription initiation factor TFIID subunit 2
MTDALDWVGLFYVLRVFQTRFCYPPEVEPSEHQLDCQCLPKPNDFSNLSEYFLQKVRGPIFE